MGKINVTPELLDYCRDIRRHLHRFPEVSFREEKTAGYIIDQLGRLGLEGRPVAGTGVYTVIGGENPSPVVAFRADTDALPVSEENDVSYASEIPGMMHACGHDGHTAILLGLASVLARHRAEIRGRVILLFQPAEESPPGGALAVTESGDLEGVQAIFGLHLTNLLPLGMVGLRPGPMMASVDNFEVSITGVGGHGAMPHFCIDPIVTGSQLVSAWQTIVSRRVDPMEPAVLTVGTFNAGTKQNIIPGTAVLTGCVRTLSETVREGVERDFRLITDQVCRSAGAAVEIRYERGYPVLVNDSRLAGIVEEAAGSCLGENNVVRMNPVMGSEDFAYYSRLCPTAYFFLGAGNPDRGFTYQNHNPRFDFDEEAMPVGVLVFLALLERLWSEKSDQQKAGLYN